MSDKKIKILTLGDMPLSPSGVGIQTKYMINALLKSGKFKVISLGGAIKHKEYTPMKTNEWGEDWIIFPIDGYGNPDIIRSIIRNEKPDVFWFMTDPRFYEWLWDIENEIRPLVPMVYYHVWDNYPYPKFNKVFYSSNDVIATISKVTDDIVANVTPDVDRVYIPHAVDSDVFKLFSEEDVKKLRKENFEDDENDKFLFFWNNRNARRKMSGSLVWWFKEFLDIVGHDNARLIMHTDPYDPNGPNLDIMIRELGIDKGEIMFSRAKVEPSHLAAMYNMADCTVNVADAEGFGLSTLESLSCGTPIVVNMTGGLQEQVTDGENWFGIGIEPASRAVIGSQQVPFIFEDRVSKQDFINALLKIYNTPKKERDEMGQKGRQHVIKNYSFETFEKQWVDTLIRINKQCGSWENRKQYSSWTFKEVA